MAETISDIEGSTNNRVKDDSTSITSNSDKELIKIWNPQVAIVLSVAFSALFAILIHRRNWKTLGNADAVVKCNYFLMGFAIYFLLYIGLVLAVDFDLPNWASLLPTLLYLAIFDFVLGQKQIKYAKNELQGQYARKGWIGPIALALLCTLAVGTALIAAVKHAESTSTSGVGGLMQKAQVADYSSANKPIVSKGVAESIDGRWVIQADGTPVRFDISGPAKTVVVGGRSFDVVVTGLDESTGQIEMALSFDGNLVLVWHLRKMDVAGGHFVLALTTSQSDQALLTFVGR